MSHGFFLESDSYYLPLHRDRPGSGPGEKRASNAKQQLPHSGTQAYRKLDDSILSTLVGGTNYGHLGRGVVISCNHISLSQLERQCAREFH